MSTMRVAEPHVTAGAEAVAATVPTIEQRARERVRAYLASLRLRDPDLLDSLTSDCLNRAHKRVARGAEEELSRRALEEAQRCIDRALARHLGISPSRDGHKLAAARAALLLCGTDSSSDFLFHDFHDQEGIAERMAALSGRLPCPTPPEAHQAMPPQKFAFLFFQSA